MGLLATGCGNSHGSDRAAILKVMEAGRTALLAGDGQRACALMTPVERARSTAAFSKSDFGYDEEGGYPRSSGPLPKSCEELVRREAKEGNIPRADLRKSIFSVTSIKGSRATVRLRVQENHGPRVGFVLRKTQAGWRIDGSDAEPRGN
jgi:hypothetical protein